MLQTSLLKKLLTGCTLFYSVQGFSQSTPRTVPSAYSGTAPINYVRTWEVVAPETNSNNLTTATTIDKARMTTQYIDGLGRPVQTVSKGVTPLGKDMVSAVEYDEFGREPYQYLPFAANSAGGNASISDGLFKLNPFEQQAAFYGNASTSPVKGQGETFYYGQTVFEASPLNRVVKTMAAGNSWAGAARGVEVQYLINAISDSVRIWMVSSTVATAPVTTATYNAGELYKTITLDESSKQVVEYKDKEGRVVLKKVQLSNSPSSGHAGWLCTYYVYDDLGNLRFVLQPKAVEALLSNGNWTITTTIRDELCFYYGYDARNRMTVKKVPGAGEVWMVYDKRDRLVMTQDANLRTGTKKWLVTLYDDLNRPVKTGLWTESNDRGYHETQAGASTNYYYPFLSAATPSTGFEVLTETGYDNYSLLPAGAPSGSIDNTYITSANFIMSANTAPDYAQSITQSLQTRGLVTWSKVKVLGSSPDKYLYAVNIYDDKGRVVQVKSKNLSDGTDIATTQFDFSGKVLRTHVKHEKAGTNANTYQVLTINSYDVAGRLTSIKKRVNNSTTNNTTDKTILQNSYDELGQLKSKKLGQDPNNSLNPLEILSYDYNIRGWMLGANRDYAKSTTSTSNYFGFDLGYDKTGVASSTGSSLGSYSASQFNGNISGMVWKSTGDDEIRKYDFTYDAVNRLTAADFNQYSNGFNKNAAIDYSVSGLSYDENGNINTLTQKGWKVGGSTTIDNLTYGYNPNSNKLQAVTDASNDNSSKLGDFKYDPSTKTTTDYSYDGNGNLISDLNKKISTIFYNHLNLPDSIVVSGKGSVKYTYDALGNKLKKAVHETGKPDAVTLYLLGNYQNDTLQFIALEEGRIRPRTTDNTFQYDYFVKDHLGNVRMVLTEEVKTDPYETLTFEEVNKSQQNAQWENRQGTSINVEGVRSTVSMNTGQTNAMLVRKSTGSIGATKLLKVMAGDRIHTKVDYYYNTSSADNSSTNALSNIVSSIVNSITNTAAPSALIHGGESTINTQLSSNSDLGAVVNTAAATNPNNSLQQAPRAYLCVLFFDERFGFDKNSSVVVPVGYNPGQRTTLDKTFSNAIEARKNGYAYIYFTNESDELVFFDNFYLSHERGPLLEESHYYPFGLTMSGISSRASGDVNKYQFNGNELQNKEFGDGGGLEMYDFNSRFYDHQIGRFRQIDPLSNQGGQENWTPYHFGFNNPILRNDPTGMFAPIYDTEGNLLGTDDQGLQGKAIVMDKENFQQGMKHDDAMQNSLGVQGLEDDAAGKKLLGSYNGLKDRPDYDGFVTRREGIDWAKSHPGALQNPTPENMLYIDASKLDFGNITTHDFKNGLNKPTPIQLNSADNFIDGYLFGGKLEGTVYALGRVNMILLDNSGSVKIVNDEATDYDWNRGGGWPRSYLIDRERKNEGLNDTHGFKTFYYGTGHLRPAVKLPEPGTLEFEMVR